MVMEMGLAMGDRSRGYCMSGPAMARAISGAGSGFHVGWGFHFGVGGLALGYHFMGFEQFPIFPNFLRS